MHTWAGLLLAASAFATGAGVPLANPQARGLYVEEEPATTPVDESQVTCSELTNNNTTFGGVAKNNATQASIKIRVAPSLQPSSTKISAPVSFQNKTVKIIDLPTKKTNRTEKIVFSQPIPIYQSFDNTSSQRNSTRKNKRSKRLKSNLRNQGKEVLIELETITTKLPNEDALSDRTPQHLNEPVKQLKLSKHRNTDAEQQTSQRVSKQNASVAASRRKGLTQTPVNATGASKLSKSSHELATNYGANITCKPEHPIKPLSSDVDSNIDIHSWPTTQTPSPVMSSQVGRIAEDDHEDLKSNERENQTLISPERI